MENDIILACKRKCIAIRLTFKRKELHSFSFFLPKIKFLAYNNNPGEFNIFLSGKNGGLHYIILQSAFGFSKEI